MELNFASIVAILGVAAFIGSMIVYVKGSYTKSSIEFLRGEVSDLRVGNESCKKIIAEQKITIAELSGQVIAMEKLLRRIPAINGKKK